VPATEVTALIHYARERGICLTSADSAYAKSATFRNVFATSIKAPVAEILRTVQVMLSLAKLILPALKILRREALRFSPGAAPDGPERAGATFETCLFGAGCMPDAISWTSIAGIVDAHGLGKARFDFARRKYIGLYLKIVEDFLSPDFSGDTYQLKRRENLLDLRTVAAEWQ
jgi:hypothetical protein